MFDAFKTTQFQCNRKVLNENLIRFSSHIIDAIMASAFFYIEEIKRFFAFLRFIKANLPLAVVQELIQEIKRWSVKI